MMLRGLPVRSRLVKLSEADVVECIRAANAKPEGRGKFFIGPLRKLIRDRYGLTDETFPSVRTVEYWYRIIWGREWDWREMKAPHPGWGRKQRRPELARWK